MRGFKGRTGYGEAVRTGDLVRTEDNLSKDSTPRKSPPVFFYGGSMVQFMNPLGLHHAMMQRHF
ncbi:MAG TPA: hypothetical protein DDY17_06940 [Syntrophaceae bacterium]|nr:hypothetical protein [Syntrophaceae bacterium]